ncbi:putative non-specific serine/threonine protein kinase [Helianthus annuus]|nr:putative non-specific serine/threonine protein kinase [Helianthus annuus]
MSSNNHLLIFLTLTLLQSLLFIHADVSDSQQLLLFKSALQNPNLLPNWLAGNNACSFTGVTCTNSTVSAINLTDIKEKREKAEFSVLRYFLGFHLFLWFAHVLGDSGIIWC